MAKQTQTRAWGQLGRIAKFLASEDIGKLVSGLFNSLKPVPIELEVTYEQAVKYFVECKPKFANVSKGVLKKVQEKEKIELTWLFLDDDDKLVLQPDGNKCIQQTYAKKLDAELEECFGDKDLVVFT